MSLTNIYQQIYDADIASASGLPALVTGESTSEASGYVVVTESEQASSVEDVIATHLIPPSKQRSYQLAEALFDNYDLDSSIPDDITFEEAAEVDDLLMEIVDSPPMALARKFIEAGSARTLTDQSWYARVKDTWFRPFTVSSSPTRSGFEHVFLGEAKDGKVGGLHWWYFYLNKMKDTDYRGAVYSNVAQGIAIPELATLSFTWNVGGQRLVKDIGGFFVGISVEGLMAMGMVRAAEDAPAPNIVVLQGAEVELKMFKSDDRRSVNTFYPVFRRTVSTVRTSTTDTSADLAPAPSESKAVANGTEQSAVRLLAVMANPAGDDTGRENVTMINVSMQRALLLGWSVVGPNQSALKFGEVWLEPGEARTFQVPSKGSLQLSNKGGQIKVVDAKGRVVQTVQYSSEAARVQGGVLLWNVAGELVLSS